MDSNKTEELLLKYGSLMDSGVQPHQSADDKDHNRNGLKISTLELRFNSERDRKVVMPW